MPVDYSHDESQRQPPKRPLGIQVAERDSADAGGGYLLRKVAIALGWLMLLAIVGSAFDQGTVPGLLVVAIIGLLDIRMKVGALGRGQAQLVEKLPRLPRRPASSRKRPRRSQPPSAQTPRQPRRIASSATASQTPDARRERPRRRTSSSSATNRRRHDGATSRRRPARRCSRPTGCPTLNLEAAMNSIT
jgi:hypothetical protein